VTRPAGRGRPGNLQAAAPAARPVPLRSPLHAAHVGRGATFTGFAGYEMPVHFGSIVEEHMAVRQAAGLFDVSHMSNLWVTGAHAAAVLSRVTPSDAAGLAVGKAKYTVVLREDGTILDDAIYYKTAEDRFFLVPNAGRNEDVARHLAAHAPEGVDVEDVTRGTAILALQGPRAPDVLAAASGDAAPKPFRVTSMDVAGVACLVGGTGYTGEKGVELHLAADRAVGVWERLLEEGADLGVRPIGLGARDTLRLEKGYCLAGNEFAGGRTPLEAGLGWLIDRKVDFLGRAAIERQEGTDHDRLVGLVQEKGVPRHGYAVHKGGKPIGTVTSGSLSPVLGKGIALAYLRGADVGDAVEVEVRGRPMAASVVKTPFV